MRSILTHATDFVPDRIHPALSGFYDECCATLARLVAYMGALGLLAIIGLSCLGQLPLGRGGDRSERQGWSEATRSAQAFAISEFDFQDKTEAYEIFRHPGGGRKDVFRWAAREGEVPIAELEIYRPGTESIETGDPGAELVASMSSAGGQPEAAGVLASKFGTITLLRNTGDTNPARACLGFIRDFDQPRLQISGWSCQGAAWPARRAAIGCMLDRLVLLTAGNDRKLAELFASAELRRGSCASVASATGASDWVTSAENPGLRRGF